MIRAGESIDYMFNDLLNSKLVSEDVKELVRKSIEFQHKSPEDMAAFCGKSNFTLEHTDERGVHPPSAIHYRDVYGQNTQGRTKYSAKYYLLKSIEGYWFSVPASRTVFTPYAGGPTYKVMDYKGYKYAVKTGGKK